MLKNKNIFILIVLFFTLNPLNVLADTQTAQPVLFKDSTVTGNITSATGSSSMVVIGTNGKSVVDISIPNSATFSGNLTPVASVDGVNYTSIYAEPTNGGNPINSITAGGSWSVPAAGYADVGLMASSFSSGTAPVNLRASNGNSVISCLYNCNQGLSPYYAHVKEAILLGFATGTVSTSTTYPAVILPNYQNGKIVAFRATGSTTDNGTTVFTVYKNGTSIGTLNFANGNFLTTTTLGTSLSVVANDVITLKCTTAGTIQNVGVVLELNQDSQ